MMDWLPLQRLHEHAGQRPDAAMWCTPDGAVGLSWAQGAAGVGRWAAWLRAQGLAGQVLLVGFDAHDAPLAVLAGLACGCVVLPVPKHSPPHQWRHLAGLAAPLVAERGRCLWVGGPGAEGPTAAWPSFAGGVIRDPLDGSAEGRLLLLSSGTTGPSKLVERTAHSLAGVAANVAGAVGLTPADRVLAAVAMSHSYGIENGLLAPLVAGAAAVRLPRFEPGALARAVVDAGPTVLPGVPAFYEALACLALDAAALSGLRCAYAAGALMPEGLRRTLRDRLGVSVGQLYGATEIGSVTFAEGDGLPEPDPRRALSAGVCVGRPMPGVALSVAGPQHQVLVDSPYAMRGYVGGVDGEIWRGGAFATGDQGRLDEHGRLWLTGRLGLMFEVGGLKVNPIDVERTLAGHAWVKASAVLPSVQGPVTRVRAVIELAEDAPQQAAKPAWVRAYLKERLPPHQVPRVISFGVLPRTPTGKLIRRALMP